MVGGTAVMGRWGEAPVPELCTSVVSRAGKLLVDILAMAAVELTADR